MVDINYLILQMRTLWPRKFRVISWKSLHLDNTFFLEVLKHSEQAWPKAEVLSSLVQVSFRPSFQSVFPI